MFLVDFLSFISVIGIWPRFIEPYLLKTTHLKWNLCPKEKHLSGLKILQISDLHFHRQMSRAFLNKITAQIDSLRPDLILFTGDFICYSRLENPENLLLFLKKLTAPLGAFCIFGNHDYARYVSKNPNGIYDVLPAKNPLKGIYRGIKTLCSSIPAGYHVTEQARAVGQHKELIALLHQTPLTILENSTVTLPIGLNVTGVGDVSLGRCNPARAFLTYKSQFPGIILSHNPDTIPQLLPFPGEWILAGHTHGEQIHFKWPQIARQLTKKLTRLVHQEYTRGHHLHGTKNIYITRGLGSFPAFRLGSPPEIVLITAMYHG